MNRYLYCGGNPVSRTDASGRGPEIIILGLIALGFMAYEIYDGIRLAKEKREQLQGLTAGGTTIPPEPNQSTGTGYVGPIGPNPPPPAPSPDPTDGGNGLPIPGAGNGGIVGAAASAAGHWVGALQF